VEVQLQLQLEILLKVLKFCLRVFIWIIPGLLAVNVFMELGFFRRLIVPMGWFFGRFANLPREIAVAFISSFGSAYAGGSMLVNFREQGLLNDRQVFLSAITFSLPTHIRELLSYYLPVILPLLGITLGGIYLAVHTMSIVVKLLFVIMMGKLTLPGTSESSEQLLKEDAGAEKNLSLALKNSLQHCIKPLKRMAVTIPLAALVIFELNALGAFQAIPVQAESLGLPSCSTACLVAYMANTLMGLTSLAACYQGGELTLVQAVKTMLWGSLLAAPVFLIRFSGTYYIGVYGPVLGMKLALTSFALNGLVYAVCLVTVMQIG